MTIESVDILRNAFDSGVMRPLHFRKTQLKSLFKMMEVHEKDFCESLKKDLNKSVGEAKLSEILLCKQEISELIKNMDTWLANEKVSKSLLTISDGVWVQKQPYGVALLIGTWNFPLFVTIIPLAGLLAAGNCVIFKPSEVAVHTEKLISELIPKYLDQSVCRVELGDAARTGEILKERFDYIMFTGSPFVGKIIMEAASKNLTPVTLELGGKSPCYIGNEVQMKMAVKRIVWGKFLNAGQTCICPDYILCHKDKQEEFTKMTLATIKDFYTADPSSSPDYGHIINSKHYNRLMDLLKETKGKVITGGEGKEDILYIAPTVVVLESKDDILMQSEIFGPILPIITVETDEEAITYINKHEKPLALYVFSDNKIVQQRFEEETSSGSLVYNDCLMQSAVKGLPFGGVGNSGLGRVHGKFSIDEFSHRRAVLDKDTGETMNNLYRYPPFTKKKEGWMDWGLKSDARDKSGLCSIM